MQVYKGSIAITTFSYMDTVSNKCSICCPRRTNKPPTHAHLATKESFTNNPVKGPSFHLLARFQTLQTQHVDYDQVFIHLQLEGDSGATLRWPNSLPTPWSLRRTRHPVQPPTCHCRCFFFICFWLARNSSQFISHKILPQNPDLKGLKRSICTLMKTLLVISACIQGWETLQTNACSIINQSWTNVSQWFPINPSYHTPLICFTITHPAKSPPTRLGQITVNPEYNVIFP